MKKLKTLRENWNNCSKCSLCQDRTQVVHGVGNPSAHLMMIGEAPGENEDLKGIPFVGEAGQLFDKMCNALELSRYNDMWITNVCLCRPKSNKPGKKNRAPSALEIEACRPRLEEEIDIVKPKIVVLSGNTPLFAFTGKRGITKNRGWISRKFDSDFPFMVYATLHPASLLYGGPSQIAQKKGWLWQDWQKIAEEYFNLGDNIAKNKNEKEGIKEH